MSCGKKLKNHMVRFGAGILVLIICMTSEYAGIVNAYAYEVKTGYYNGSMLVEKGAKKDKFEYTKQLYMTERCSHILNVVDWTWREYKIKNLKTDSKNIRVELEQGSKSSFASLIVRAKKPGTYHVKYQVEYRDKKKSKKKTINLETTIYVYKEYSTNPIKGVTMDGKKLKEKVTSGYDWRDDFYMPEEDEKKESDIVDAYFTKKYKGKLKVIPNKGYTITKLLICGSHFDDFGLETSRYDSCSNGGDYGKKVKNGAKVKLNHLASGKSQYICTENGMYQQPWNIVDETYKMNTALTKVRVYYKDKNSKANLTTDIYLCTNATDF